ncbi:hypothetical protein ACIBL8_41230 [Streptomyces sp. NPDC050523]|uniref:hypothetical protein n=1 Tax=Streptomyces sp. NPDC050523 TaxID=3365622 RepID=UPI0037B3349C
MADNCSLLSSQARKICDQDGPHRAPGGGGSADPCDAIKGPGKAYCERVPDSHAPGTGGAGGASDHVRTLADSLIAKIEGLIAPGHGWAPAKSTSGLYEPFLWLGQHLAVAIFVCVVVVCALTAWQGTPRLKQMGASTGWTLVAVAGMASVPGAVMLLNKAVSGAFTAAFSSNESTLFGAISDDMQHGADSGNPLAILIIFSALVVALAFAALVFMTRQLGILAFVCMAPLVLASLARGGDTTAVKTWAMRLLGLMFAPFALLLVSPFVELAKGSLVVDAVLLIAADALMLRMIFHGVPYFGPKVARAARSYVEGRTPSSLAHAVVRAGVPDFYEKENVPRGPRTVNTPGRAMSQDRGVLFAAYGLNKPDRSGRLTTASAVAKEQRDKRETAARRQQLREVREQYRTTPQRAPAAQPDTAPTPAPAPSAQDPAATAPPASDPSPTV